MAAEKDREAVNGCYRLVAALPLDEKLMAERWQREEEKNDRSTCLLAQPLCLRCSAQPIQPQLQHHLCSLHLGQLRLAVLQHVHQVLLAGTVV